MTMRQILIGLVLAVTASSVLAFDRNFPPTARRGKMTAGSFPEILIDGKVRRLSMGGLIWNQDNVLEIPTSLQGRDIVVNYTVDGMGEIDKVWILSPSEAAQTPAQQRVLPGAPPPAPSVM